MSQGPPITKATALANAKAIAAQQGATAEKAQRVVTDASDQYDSRWSRDPGRANGPFS